MLRTLIPLGYRLNIDFQKSLKQIL